MSSIAEETVVGGREGCKMFATNVKDGVIGLQIIWLELLPLQGILLPTPTLREWREYHFEYAS